MVLGVCRSVLRNTADAEDAGQAVFLTLARRARSLKRRVTLAGWLHRVAWFVALRSAAAAKIRRQHERRAASMKLEVMAKEPEPSGAVELLHKELAEMPEKYRVALLLHHVEGCSEAETAALLGCGASAASVRLARGRKMLREKLAKRGVVVTAAGLVRVLESGAKAEVPSTFAIATTQAGAGVLAGKAASAVVSAKVAALSKGALKMLFIAKMKWVGIAAAACVVTGAVTIEAARADSVPTKNTAREPVGATGGSAGMTPATSGAKQGNQGNGGTSSPKAKTNKVRPATGSGNSGSVAGGSGQSGDGQNRNAQNGDGQNGDGQNADGQHGDGQNGNGANGDGAHGDGQNYDGANGDGQNNTNATGGGVNTNAKNGSGKVSTNK
jgi:RNA polymerase sigma factor (sigma-70 family)